MNNFLLRYNGTAYTPESLLNQRLVVPPGAFSHSLFTFLHDWLNGRETFRLPTSGSTGTQKWITVHREQLIQSARTTNAFLGFGPRMTGLLCLSPDYIAGKMMIIRCLTAGATLLAVEPSSQPLQSVPNDQAIDLAAMVPMQVSSILGGPAPESINAIGTLLIGGGAPHPGLVKSLKNVRTKCFATFGMTESLSHVAMQRLNGENPENTYHALPQIRFESDKRGCLVIHAPFLNDPLETQDVVELISASEFRWLGRIDNMINSGGIKLFPEVLEMKLTPVFAAAGIDRRFILLPKQHPLFGQVARLVFEGDAMNKDELDGIRALMRTHLDRFEIPEEIDFVPHFVQTPTGKVNRSMTMDLLGKEGPARLS